MKNKMPVMPEMSLHLNLANPVIVNQDVGLSGSKYEK
jgi:hypothetical protein